ncbi:hypothetical protein [Wenyingzhuangia sp. IMCC45574]
MKPDPISGGGTGGAAEIFDKNVIIVGSGDASKAGSGSISFISTTGTLTRGIYNRTNTDRTLNNPTSFGRDGSLGYICTEDGLYTTYNFKFLHDTALKDSEGNIQSITDIKDGLYQPKDIVIDGSSAHVINWGINEATSTEQAFIETLSIGQNEFPKSTKTINLDEEKPISFVLQSEKFVVIHQDKNIISIVDPEASESNNVIPVTSLPLKLISLPNGNAAVLCAGDVEDDANNAIIYEIDIDTETISIKVAFGPREEPKSFDFANNSYYYTLQPNIYRIQPNATNSVNSSSATKLLDSNANSDIAVSDNVIYAINQNDAGSQANFFAYDIDSRTSIKSSILDERGTVRIYLQDKDFGYNPNF